MGRRLYIDIETYSSEDITKSGHYRYAMDKDFDILLIAYAFDDDPVRCIDLASGEKFPAWLWQSFENPNIIKYAHNATFERVCFSMWLRKHRSKIFHDSFWLDPSSWRCTSVLASMCGLPMSLKDAGAALKLTDQKMSEGKDLIKLFCMPHKTDNGGLYEQSERVSPADHPEKWETFKRYCIRDVEVERSIARACDWLDVPESEWALYAIDQNINDRGVRLDMTMVTNANRMDGLTRAHLSANAYRMTSLDNPNSLAQLKGWVSDQLGIEVASLTKKDIPELRKIAEEKGNDLVLQMLQTRSELGKTSNAKYTAMLRAVCSDERVHGVTQFYGSRTGRWAGRIVQLQNLPQNHIEDLEGARQLVCEDDYGTLELCFGNVPDTLSQLIRTAFIPAEGKMFAVCDFSAIEARVLAWMAGEEWVLDTFRQGGDIYCATATQMFHVPVKKHGENSHLRQRGKVAVLALGYGGGVNALDQMGGKKLGMTEDEEKETVQMWRAANPHITKIWSDIEKAVREAVTYKTDRVLELPHTKLRFSWNEDAKTLGIQLPSGRTICYREMELHFDAGDDWAYLGQTAAQAAADSSFIKKERKSLHPQKYIADRGARLRYRGQNQTTGKWEWIETWGGKLTENVTQAIARDCLASVMKRCEENGFPTVFHVHDELVMEVPADTADKCLDSIEGLFAINDAWNQLLPLRGAGYLGNYYFKD